MQFSNLLFTIEDNICTITINRPDKLNALNSEVIHELGQALDEVYSSKEIKSAIVTGAGEKAFVAGADISDFQGLNDAGARSLATKGQQLFFKIENCPKPVVAAVNGFALGGGCELAMACHFRLAGETAKFGQPEVNLGLLPGYGGTQRLTQLIGKGRAIEMLVTGNMIDAVTAFNYGLVNHVVPQNELLLKTKSILSIINSKAPLAVASCIAAANAAFEPEQNGYNMEADTFAQLINTHDTKEGISAFLQKRKAQFRGE